jgi:hypothetical protein
MTQSTSLAEDSLSDGPLDATNWIPSRASFSAKAIPEEASFLSSEGFQGDRIQGTPP